MTTSFFLIIFCMVALLPAKTIEDIPSPASGGDRWSVVTGTSDRIRSSLMPSTSTIDNISGSSSSNKSPHLEQYNHNARASAASVIHQMHYPGALLPPSPPPPLSLLPKPLAQKQNAQNTINNSTTSICGGYYRTSTGNIQTPNFPRKFETPIECVWIVDASEIHAAAGPGTNVSIVVYLTQLYVLGGLKFTEYMYYSDDYKVPSHRIFQLTEDDVTKVAWIQFTSQYLEIRFEMRTLDGTHLRALDRLLDVYGFNITYEVDANVKPYQCNALQCRFLGHCYANVDYTAYHCVCFPGFSGSDCGRGPLCEDPHTNFCQNGGTCKHIGDAAITCHCPPGFKGNKCEISEINEITMGCKGNSSKDCHKECDFQNAFSNVPIISRAANSGRISARTGKTRFEVTIRLGTNLTAFYRSMDGEKRTPEQIPSILERHMSRVLRNFNITKISDLELISNSTDRLDITFHFFGVKSDSIRIREAITRMVERGRIGNITLVSNFHLFDENPPLNLLDTLVNQKLPIREDTEFIISCVAQGSSRIEFQWYKDGAVVNASRATREIWTTVLPPESKDIYTAILGITKANRMDEGVYTCKVVDWGVEQCRSIHVHIRTPPHLRVDPASVTLHRGDSLRVRCLSPGNDIKRYGQLGYSWTRNGVLFQSNPQTVMWEDLYPDGSILKINNIQKSAEYSCVVSNSVSPVSKSVYVTVIDKNVVELCHAEKSYGVRWPTSAPGAPIVSDCPQRYQGHSLRVCEKRDIGNSTWLQPDLSHCVSDQLIETYNKFRALTSGYQKTNFSAILKSCLEYTSKRNQIFLPGEAGFLMDLLQEVESYLEVKGSQLEREMASEIVLHILDKVMQNAVSLNSQQQIKKLQLLTQSAALSRETIAASQLATSTSSTSSSPSSSLSLSSAGTAGGMRIASSSSSSSTHTASSSSSLASSASISMSASSSSSSSLSPSSSSSSSSNSGVGGSSSGTNSRSPLSSSPPAAGKSTSVFTEGVGATVTFDEETLSLDRLNSLRIYMRAVKTLPFNLRLYGDDLFADQLYMDIALSTHLQNIMANSTIFASVISYKNLKSFLPKTYYSRGSDSKDTDYVLASRVVQTWLFQSNRSNDNMREPLDLPFDAGHVDIIFQHESRNINSDWIPMCGHDYKATFESTWRTDLCITKNLMENITRCICPLSGTFVVLLAKKNYNTTTIRPSARPIFVIISCGCCFLQSCTAFAILLPIWYNRRCCITFLKMQFCTSTSSVMVIFLLGFLKMLPQGWQAIISSTLASLMLLGLSTIIAIGLVVHTELVPRKFQVTNLSSGIRGAIGISWLLPLLFAICSPLISNIIGKWPNHWWLEVGSSGFVLFVVVEILFMALFGLLLYSLIRKLLWLLRKHDKHAASIWRRIGLLYRTGIILVLKLLTESLFVAYLNVTGDYFLSHIFGISCILLGFSILFCFVVKAEYGLRKAPDPPPRTNAKTSLDDNYCSGSINSPLSFYTNQEKEKDNESGAPLQQSPPDATTPHLPLTIISTAPRCQMVTGLQAAKSVETFLGMVVVGMGTGGAHPTGSYGSKNTKLHDMEQYHTLETGGEQGLGKSMSAIADGGNISSSSGSNSKSRCCNILLGGGSSGGGRDSGSKNNDNDNDNDTSTWQRRPHEGTDTRGFYDAYTPNAAMMGSGHQHHHLHHHATSGTGQITKCSLPESHEFVGVETLDILQGVSPDSIIGIRTSTILTKNSPSRSGQQHHKPFVECIPTINTPASQPTSTSVKTQTPKSQKRVTIVETPKITHTFDPLAATATVTPASCSTAIITGLHGLDSSPPTPIITITSSSIDQGDNCSAVAVTDGADRQLITPQDPASQMKENTRVTQLEETAGIEEEDSINGMLDRISHDLDYLLNRTNEIPQRLISGVLPPTTSTVMENNVSGSPTLFQSSQPKPSNLTAVSIECDSFPNSHCPSVDPRELESIPPPPLPPSSVIPVTASTSSLRTRTSVHHEVIMEEDGEQDQE